MVITAFIMPVILITFRFFAETPIFSVSTLTLRALVSRRYSGKHHHHHVRNPINRNRSRESSKFVSAVYHLPVSQSHCVLLTGQDRLAALFMLQWQARTAHDDTSDRE